MAPFPRPRKAEEKTTLAREDWTKVIHWLSIAGC